MARAIYIKGVAVTNYKRDVVSNTDEWPSKYSKFFFIELDDELELSYTDKRRFAKVRLLNNPAIVPPVSELGSDALFEPLAIDELVSALSKKKIGIKALLFDQISFNLTTYTIRDPQRKIVIMSSMLPGHWHSVQLNALPRKVTIDLKIKNGYLLKDPQ